MTLSDAYHLGRGGSGKVLNVRVIFVRVFAYLKKENSEMTSIDISQ